MPASATYAEGSHTAEAPPAWLEEVAGHLPSAGSALDVVAGAGRVACALARHGLRVCAVDVSPLGLELARERAGAQGLRLATRTLDLVHEPFPPGPWQLIACFDYLQRHLFAYFRSELASGGLLVCELATLRNLERHARPSRRFLLEEGELRELVAPLELVRDEEGWFDGRARNTGSSRALSHARSRISARPAERLWPSPATSRSTTTAQPRSLPRARPSGRSTCL